MVPSQGADANPNSDVVAWIDLYIWRFVCYECLLSDGGCTETESLDEMVAHLDAHRAAGHRVSDQCLKDLLSLDFWDEGVRTTYSSRWRAEDENLTVKRLTFGDGLHCYRCVLNSGREVKCFSTEQMVQHLDEHRMWGLPVPQHVYEKLARHRSENDDLFASYYERRGESPPSTLLCEPPPLLAYRSEIWSHRDALNILSSLLATAISHFEGPLSQSDHAAGWTETLCDDAAKVLGGVLREVEIANRDQDIDFWCAGWESVCKNWIDDIKALEDGLRESRKAPFDPPYEALHDLSGIIQFVVLTGGVRPIEWHMQRSEKRVS